jgi:hypothetical protein
MHGKRDSIVVYKSEFLPDSSLFCVIVHPLKRGLFAIIWQLAFFV